MKTYTNKVLKPRLTSWKNLLLSIKSVALLMCLLWAEYGLGQTVFYSQGFETSNDWTLSHSSYSNYNNYWVYGNGTAGATTGAATHTGSRSLQIWCYYGGGWYSDYYSTNTSSYSRTASKTFDFSSIPVGSTITFSYWILVNGETSYDDYRLYNVTAGSVIHSPAKYTSWTKKTCDLSSYAGSSVTLRFEWRNDGSWAYQPGARIDDIEVTYTSPCTTPNTYTVTGGGSYCSGGGGVAVGLSGSQSGVTYQLYRGGTPVGSTVAGTGSAISFGNQTTAGTYTVQTTTAGGYCATTMTGSAVVTVLNVPSAPTTGTHVLSESQVVWNWNAVSGATGYKWNTSTNYATATDMGTSTSKTETGLQCGTTYTRYIWAYNSCGESTSYTTITAEPTDVLLNEGFEGSFLPTGWTQYDETGDASTETWSQGSFGGYTTPTGSNAAIINWDYDIVNRALQTPVINITDYSGVNLSYYVFIDYNYDEIVYVEITTDGGTNWTSLASHGTSYSGWSPQQNISLDSYIGNSISLRFRYYQPYDDNSSGIDGVLISGCPISCPMPTSVYASNITSNSATLNWTAPSTPPANGYEYYYSTSSTPPSSGTDNSDTDINLSSLSPATTYYVWVRSDCGGGDFSSWTTMYQFTTNASPCTITSFNFTGSSRIPTLDGGYYYFDVCKDETLTLQANATCTNCGSATNYNWVINAHDGNGDVNYSSNPLSYDIDYASGYDALLEIEGNACYSSYPLRFRSSDGPEIGNISASISGCSGDGTEITVGASGSSVEVEAYHGEVAASLGVGAETFIPDGPSCATQCYESSVTFTDFAPGATITSADDIRYVKINLEHSFIGDMQITLEGPEGCGSAVILPDNNSVSYDWPWTFVGFYCGDFEGYGKLVGGEWYTTMDFDEITVFETEADAHAAATTYPLNFSCSWAAYDIFVAKTALGVPNTDDLTTSTDPCDGTEWYNDSGTGWDYCWSNNSSYSYSSSTNSYIYEPENVDFYDSAEASYSFVRVNPSDETAGTNFYHPYEDFYTELEGCPLNGTWTIKVCDSWKIDNGWIFDWELALDPDLLPTNWDYNVDVVDVDWSGISDANFTGTYPNFNLIPNPGLSGVSSGTFTVEDEFGCTSDANLSFNVTGLPTISGLASGDYVWAGFEGQNWNQDFHNWFVYDGSGYNYASSFPSTTNNVHIIDYCSNPDPLVVNSNASCKNLYIANNVSLTMSGTTPYTLDIYGNWNNNGTFNAGISTVKFSGSAGQSLTTVAAGGELFYKLNINKTAGTKLTSSKNITVSNELTFNSGIVDLGTNTLFLTNSSSSSLVGGSTSGTDKYILGKLQRTTTGTGTYTFPIGYTGHGAQGISVKLNSSSGTPNLLAFLEPNTTSPIYSIAYCDVEAHPGGGTHIIGTGTSGYDGILDKIEFNLASVLQWDVTNPGGGISSYDITVYGNGTNNFTPITTANSVELRYLMKNGQPGNAGVPTGTAEPSFSETGFLLCPTGYSLTGLTSFSDFDLRGANGGGSVLPVELINFDAFCNNGDVKIVWQTATELNSHYFILEYSYDMVSFAEVVRLPAAGNSNMINFYEADFAADKNKTVYLRLKQVDYDGTLRIYKTISINCSNQDEEPYLIVFPNPFENSFTINSGNLANGDVKIEILDELGRIVYSKNIKSDGTDIAFVIDARLLLPAMYHLRVISEKEILYEKIIKK